MNVVTQDASRLPRRLRCIEYPRCGKPRGVDCVASQSRACSAVQANLEQRSKLRSTRQARRNTVGNLSGKIEEVRRSALSLPVGFEPINRCHALMADIEETRLRTPGN